METKENFNAMECIESIYQFSKDSKLQPPLFEVVENEISLLSKYLQLNDIETVLFANAFVLWFENSCFSEVFEHFGMSSFQVLKYRESIEVLYQRNLLMNKESRKRQISSYELSQSVINTISKNEPLKIFQNKNTSKENNFVDLLEEFDGMSDQLDANMIHQFDFTGTGICMVMGAEDTGLRPITQAQCDQKVYIPMGGNLQSLNVSVATGMALYEVCRQRSN